MVKIKYKNYQSHRIAYYLHYKFINNELGVFHHCDNPPCVNPHHLWQGTNKDNSQDMVNKGRARGSFGEDCYKNTLNDQDILDIRNKRKYVRDKIS